MRLHFLKKKIKTVLIFTIAILLLPVLLTCTMWRSNRLPDELRSSDKAWKCSAGEINICIYNKDNLPENLLPLYTDICKNISEEFYGSEYSFEEIINSGNILLMVLMQEEIITYFMLDFNSSGNIISHDGLLIEYDTVKKCLEKVSINVNIRMVFNNLILHVDSNNKNILPDKMVFSKEK